jgi:hypothetical protein
MSDLDPSFEMKPIVQTSSAGSIDEAFQMFHAANPQVYELLVDLARRAKGRGRTRIGMKMLYEVARWHFYLSANKDDEYMLNNNYTSRYARLIQDREPDLSGMFETRRLRSE